MESDRLRSARIMLIDDEEENIRFLRRVLAGAGYSCVESTTDPREATELFERFQPDLVLLDLRMPYLDGLEVLAQLRSRIGESTYLPILVLTADTAAESKRRALSGGAKDFLAKPFSPGEVRLRIRNLLETRFLHRYVQEQNEDLETRVKERTRELEEARTEVLHRLARAAEFRDDDTGQHTRRVGELAAGIARRLDVPAAEVELIYRAAPLHDIGKIGIPDAVLLKEGRLTPAEFELMKTHTTIGARILSGSSVPVLRASEEIALTHHERWDGKGYPQGLAGTAIPLSGRIVAVADVFDSLLQARSYKLAWTVEEAVAELERQRGRHFDAQVVDAFLAIYTADVPARG